MDVHELIAIFHPATHVVETVSLEGKLYTALVLILSPELKDIHSQLTLYPDDQLIACANAFTRDLLDSTDLIGAYIVADMRTVWRAESRIDENITEQRNVKTIDDIAKALDASPILRKILAFYVSDAFTEQLNS